MSSPRPPRVLALVGTTASGKTAVGEWLAPRLRAEIGCAASRQAFREPDVAPGEPPRRGSAEGHPCTRGRGGGRATARLVARAAAAARTRGPVASRRAAGGSRRARTEDRRAHACDVRAGSARRGARDDRERAGAGVG